MLLNVRVGVRTKGSRHLMPNVFPRILAVAALAALSAACASGGPAHASFTALGYLAPGATDTPDIIGEFASEAACRAALEAWMSRQVVGNPVSGDCLPTDRL